jgi:hypothetical protein
MGSVDAMREVWAGEVGDLRWKILVERGEGGEVLSFVRRELGLAHATSGMGGPAPHPGHPVNAWTGTATGLPPFILVRTAPTVASVTVLLDRGDPVELQLSPVIDDFGLRFAASPLPVDAQVMDLQIGHDAHQD